LTPVFLRLRDHPVEIKLFYPALTCFIANEKYFAGKRKKVILFYTFFVLE
jgi:hypothetical protein